MPSKSVFRPFLARPFDPRSVLLRRTDILTLPNSDKPSEMEGLPMKFWNIEVYILEEIGNKIQCGQQDGPEVNPDGALLGIAMVGLVLSIPQGLPRTVWDFSWKGKRTQKACVSFWERMLNDPILLCRQMA